MTINSSRINFPLLVFVLLTASALFAFGWQRIEIETDIVSSLPQDDPVIRDAMYIFQNHPFQDQVTIDISLGDQADPDLLVSCAKRVAEALMESGLFKSVGMEDMADVLPKMVQEAVSRLPVLYTELELREQILPRTTPAAIERRMQKIRERLLQMDGIGQAAMIMQDPLGFSETALSKLLFLAPTDKAGIYKGQLISNDNKHLLLMATPKSSGTDTAFAKQLAEGLEKATSRVREQYAAQHIDLTLTPVGAYRAALDNETIVRADVNRALLFSSVGIALLLIFAFPRPLIGLLSLVPAVFGTMTAFFVFAMLRPSISIMVLGFGGAIISITVDHGIAYLLFLDRPQLSTGKQASKEIWAVGLLAALTTIGAFGALMISDFPILYQLGLFTALGICFSFLFVHTVFPRIFPAISAAKDRPLLLPKIADRLFSAGDKGAIAAAVVFAGLLFFAMPDFDIDLSAMNTVSTSTLAAEKKMASVWGDIFSKVFVMTEAETLDGLRNRNDALLFALEALGDDALPAGTFLPSMIFPGKARSDANLAAWKAFWTPERVNSLQRQLAVSAEAAGFTPDAFDSFVEQLIRPGKGLPLSSIPETYHKFLGISRAKASGQWRQFTSLALSPDFRADEFYKQFATAARIFDPVLFSKKLSELMAGTFIRLLWIVGLAVMVLLLIFFLNVQLTLIALAPVVFALVCTVGTLNLMGRPLDLPCLILAVVVLGMGIDYSLFMVRSYQRYGRADHPSFRLIRSAILMTSSSTLIGFGVLASADHALLNSAGVTSSLGIAYSALGVFLILPPLLKRRFESFAEIPDENADLPAKVLWRYRQLEPYARMFAKYKLRLDTLFSELSADVVFSSPPRNLLDIGTGFGVPACWIAESFPTAKIFGIEPDENRVRVADRALANRGKVVCGSAPQMPPAPDDADGAFMLDMLHFLNDDDLKLTFKGLSGKLKDHAPLVMRCVMGHASPRFAGGWFTFLREKYGAPVTYFRSENKIRTVLNDAGFQVSRTKMGGRNGDLMWVHAMRMKRVAP